MSIDEQGKGRYGERGLERDGAIGPRSRGRSGEWCSGTGILQRCANGVASRFVRRSIIEG